MKTRLVRIVPPRELTHKGAIRRLRRLATDAERSGFVLLQHDLRDIADRLEKFECRVTKTVAKGCTWDAKQPIKGYQAKVFSDEFKFRRKK